MRFRHPLLRSAAYAGLPPGERIELHRRLADAVDDVEEQAWQLALGCAGPDAEVALTLDHLPLSGREAKLQHFRVDEDHSNAFTAWKKLGSPQPPTPEQYAQLERAGQLAALDSPKPLRVENGRATVKFKLPRQAVSLLQLAW